MHLFFPVLKIEIFSVPFDRDLPGIAVTIVSSLPVGAGLGSSAAYSVCIAAGFLSSCGVVSDKRTSSQSTASIPREVEIKMRDVSGIEVATNTSSEMWNEDDLRLINKWAFEAEKLVHGMPSGIDNAVSTYGEKFCTLNLYICAHYG